MTNALLATKFYIPQPPAVPVLRPRLLAQLDAALSVPLTLISAPAGFGKTTLLSEWHHAANRRDDPLAWISLDKDDNEPLRFLGYLITALATLKPKIGDTALTLLRSPQPSPPQVLLTALINDLSTLSAPFALVLDDYHVIAAQLIQEMTGYLLDHRPPQMHLILLTRADPPLPLARLRARNQLVELRAHDLRFTREEADVFLNHAMGLALSAEDIETLDRRTEGWIAGLQLVALSLRDREDASRFIRTFGGGHSYIVDYLVEEVLNRQSEAVRTFLLQTSILERLTAPLCDALTGRGDGQATLEQLERANLFLAPVDSERCWYRYHHLFAEVMQHRLRQLYADQLADLHIRAAEWFEQNQLLGEALQHLLAAKDQGRALRFVERNGLVLLMRGELTTLLGWIKALGPQAREHPWLCIYQAWGLELTGQPDQVASWLKQAERQIPQSLTGTETNDMRGHITAIRAYAAAQRGESEDAIHLGEKALELLPEDNQVVRSVVSMTLGTAYRLSDDLGCARQSLAEAKAMGAAAGNLYLAIGATSGLADLLFDQGQLHASAEMYRELLQMATSPDGKRQPAAGMACFGLGLVSYEWNDLAAALDYALQAIELCSQWGNQGMWAASHAMLSRIRWAQGNVSAAEEALAEAEQLIRTRPTAARAPGWIQALRVRYWLVQHELEAAGHWVHESGLKTDGRVTFLNLAEYTAVGRVLLAQCEYDAALHLLGRLVEQAKASGRRGNSIELLVLQALAYRAKNDRARALATLTRALALAQPESYVRVFLDEGEAAKRLIAAHRNEVNPSNLQSYAAQLLTLLGADDPSQPRSGTWLRRPVADLQSLNDVSLQDTLIEELSDRELEVLGLVAIGKSNQEIADDLVLAVGTVKRHLNNIFGKLAAQNRTECVARAREFGLLAN